MSFLYISKVINYHIDITTSFRFLEARFAANPSTSCLMLLLAAVMSKVENVGKVYPISSSFWTQPMTAYFCASDGWSAGAFIPDCEICIVVLVLLLGRMLKMIRHWICGPN